jgi:glutathione peroxidase-family protein
VQLDTEFRSQGLQIVALTTEDPKLTSGRVRDWIRQFHVPYKVGFVSTEVVSIMIQGRDVLPQSFVISRSGRITKRFVGFGPTITPPLMKAAIEEALNEKPDVPD